MSFRLRLTSTSATGRAIVREHRVEGDVLTIGRDPASDLHLTDLEVTRHHAAIRRTARHQLVVEALAALPLVVDGRSTAHATIDASRGGEVRIGATRILIDPVDASGDIALTITRMEAVIDRKHAAARHFSLVGVAPGKRWMAWLAGLLILGLFVAWPIWSFSHTPARLTARQKAAGHIHADSAWSIGPLSRAHAALASDCKACHVGAFVAVPDSACRSCHVAIHDHADPRRLAAARVPPAGIAGIEHRIAVAFGRDDGRCADCHLEHQGATAMPPPTQAACAACHGALRNRLPDTRLGDASDFGDRHPQFRPVVTTIPGVSPHLARISLDDRPRQDTGLDFPHALHLSARGGAAQMALHLDGKPLACADCHVADDSGTRFRPVSMERNCQQCHSLAFDQVGRTVRTLRHGDTAQVIADIRDFYASHPAGPAVSASDRRRPGELRASLPGGGGGAAAAIRAVFSKGGACHDCHVVVPPTAPGSLDYRIVPVRQPQRYLEHGWFDHAAHATTACTACHGAALASNDAHDVMLPGIATCRQCHGGDRARAPRVRSSCAMCHDFHRGPGAPQALRPGPTDRRDPIVPLKLSWRGEADADRPDIGPAPELRR